MKRRCWLGLFGLLVGLGSVAATAQSSTVARILQMEDERSLGDGELERLVRSGEPEIRIRAIRAAGRIGDAAITGAVVTALTDELPEIRREAAFALSEIEDGSAFDALVGALVDPDRPTRFKAIEALGKLRDPRAEPALRAILTAEASDVEEKGAVVLQIWRFRAPESLAHRHTPCRWRRERR